jgi:ectoine hydroxylase-related dioxygenase (phytanoyl-CoA dioxygenase family)
VSPATIVRSIWLDEEDAHDQIGGKLRSGQITEREAANLTKFADDGYLIISAGVSADDAADFDANVNRLWREKPPKIAYAYDSPPRRLSWSDEHAHRRPRYRIHDMHSAFETARRFYLDRTLLRYASLILDQPAVSTQSLYFEFGSQQALHRDSIVVPTPIFGELLAAWIALENIDPASGPLEYVPGSHKLPMFEFRPGQYMFDGSSMGEPEIRAAMKFHDDESARRGLKTGRFLARRGEVLIWHSALLHGGAPVSDETKTRKSFVVHYSTLRNHPARSITLDEGGRSEVWTTRQLIERDGVRGFANPLDGELEYVRA